jgi:hypothetical protein
MNRIAVIVVTVLLFITMSGCIYTHVTMPYTTELNKTELGQKKGTSSFQSVLWLFAWGDAGAAAAAKDGGITTLRYMDREFKYVLFGIYQSQTTIVYGD